MNTSNLNSNDFELIGKLEAKKVPIQAEIDALMLQVQEAQKAVDVIRAKVKPLRANLVPLAEMQAGVASAVSRDKYFPDMSKNQFIEHVASNV